MRKALGVFAASVLLVVLGASLGMADSVTYTRHMSGFPSNDTLYWGTLGANNFDVHSGAVTTTASGIVTTVTFGTGAAGSTLVQCPSGTCTWSGNFAPTQNLLTDLNFVVGGNSGTVMLSFGTGIQDVGFQMEPNAAPASGSELSFTAEIGVYVSGMLADTFFIGGMEASHGEMNTAGFYGIQDWTGANITGIKIAAANCGGAGGACDGFAINQLLVQDAPSSVSPEPASLALLGSGLGLFGFLRRKLAARK